MWGAEELPVSPIADIRPTGGQTAPNSSDGTTADRGKPGALPSGTASRKGRLRGVGERRMEKAKATR